MEKKLEKWQIKKIYAIANKLAYVVPGKKDDVLHMLIESMTLKDSVKNLTYAEADKLISYLEQQQTLVEKQEKISEGQKRKIWALMYDLKDKDMTINPTPIGERLAGIIRRQFHVQSSPQRLFSHLNYDDGNALIEILKNYVATAERKMMN